MRRLLVILIPLLVGVGLGAAHRVRADGVCVYRSAEVQLSVSAVTYDGFDVPLDAVPAAAVFEQPPNDPLVETQDPILVIEGRRLVLSESP